MLFLFSDGASHDQNRAERVAQEMKTEGVAILCVGIGKSQYLNVYMEKLRKIASKKEYAFKSNINALATIEDSLVKEMCEAISKYTDFCPEMPCDLRNKIDFLFHILLYAMSRMLEVLFLHNNKSTKSDKKDLFAPRINILHLNCTEEEELIMQQEYQLLVITITANKVRDAAERWI